MKMELSITIFMLFLLCTNFVNGQYNAIFSFGDSYTDTGNLRILSGNTKNPPYGDPYGRTYFHHSTGRASDGRMVIDFIAQNFGLPLVPPSLSNQNFKQGANFAVIAATAMDPAYFKSINITGTSPFSLSVQLGWFDKLKPSLCSSEQECKNYFKNSLFFVGELGGNDYNAIMYSNRTVDEIKALSPQIVGTIIGAAEKVINEGAGTVVVPGILPTGCIPIVLSQAHNAPKEEFDPKTGCLIKPNDFSSHHNDLLHQAVQQLQGKYPQARVIYAEYFEAVVNFILDPIGHGFTNGHGALQVSCGGGGPYNYNSSATCGSPGSTVGDPATYANWDGIHLTEAAFKQVANGWLHGPYASPPIVS